MLSVQSLVRVSALFVLAFTTMFQLVGSVPIDAHELIVFNPKITAPTASASWPRGSVQTVSWDTKGIPREIIHNTGVLLLGYLENDSENLDIDNPLATRFPIMAGSVKVTMPRDIPSRDDYFVVLFGDSGNRSPNFRIH